MYCMMQWIEKLSLHIRLNIFFNTNIQNRPQNKLVNMVNENDLIKHKMYIPLKLSGIYFCILHIKYIFLNERILQTFFKICVYILG